MLELVDVVSKLAMVTEGDLGVVCNNLRLRVCGGCPVGSFDPRVQHRGDILVM